MAQTNRRREIGHVTPYKISPLDLGFLSVGLAGDRIHSSHVASGWDPATGIDGGTPFVDVDWISTDGADSLPEMQRDHLHQT